MLNVLNILMEDKGPLPPGYGMILEAITFFRACLDLAEGKPKSLAKQWLEEVPTIVPWLKPQKREGGREDIELVHTFKMTPWDWFLSKLAGRIPSKILVISPSYDRDARLFEGMKRLWPRCKFEITAQQNTSNIPVDSLRAIKKDIQLFALEGGGNRRLHAKLIAIPMGEKVICIVGSANFTSAALHGKNIETCLGLEISIERFDRLFDKELRRKPLDLDQFEPSDQKDSSIETDEEVHLHLLGVHLDARGKLYVEYRVNFSPLPDELSLSLHRFREEMPIRSYPLPVKTMGSKVIDLDPAVCRELKGTIRCYLVTNQNGERKISYPSWLIQESRLKYEPSDELSDRDPNRIIRETGRGLTEFLDYLIKTEGLRAVIEYLTNLNIRFHESGHLRGRGFGIRPSPHDTFRPDELPAWMHEFAKRKTGLIAAIKDFIERHEKRVLRKHARKGNINGLKNFLDVFVETNQLLYTWFSRGVLDQSYAVEKICRHLDILTCGYDYENGDWSEGYIETMKESLIGDSGLLTEKLREANVHGHARVALIIAQYIRSGRSNPIGFLPSALERMEECLNGVGLGMLNGTEIEAVLDEYTMLAEAEKIGFLSFLSQVRIEGNRIIPDRQ
jgi:hypothetical protein